MDFGFTFDATKVQPAEPGGNVWEGVVPMRIDRSETADTSKNDGSKMLVFHVTAMGGQYGGQSNVIRLNLWNRNPQACEIAQRQLSSICHCVGKMSVTNSDQLNGCFLLGIWAKEERTVTNQQTGANNTVESCQCKDFRLADGRTIKEMLSGAAPANPYNANGPQGVTAAPANTVMQPPAQPPGAPGFAPPGAPLNPQGVPPGMQGGVPAYPAAPAPAGTPPAFGTAALPSSPQAPGGYPQGVPGAPAGGGFAPPGAPAAPQGFAPPGGQPQAAPQGFGGGAPAAAPGGFQPPGAPGPWGQR